MADSSYVVDVFDFIVLLSRDRTCWGYVVSHAYFRVFFFFFFFKQKTAYEMRISDWSSDVCSSDLDLPDRRIPGRDGDHFREREVAAVVAARRHAALLDEPAHPHLCADDAARHAGLREQGARRALGGNELAQDARRAPTAADMGAGAAAL